MGATRLANAVYVAVARVAGRRLAACDGVLSVYVRRSVAAGDVSFGRSDIDLGILIRDPFARPGESGPIGRLNRAVRWIRRVMPLVGEVEVIALAEYDDWARHQAFQESLNRGALLAAGRPFEIPLHAVSVDEAAWRFGFWFERYLPRAIRRASRRDLRKFALEMWTCTAIVEGHLAEPPIGRREMQAVWQRVAPETGPPPASASLGDLVETVFDLAARLHARLLPPLRPLAGVIEAEVLLPPKLQPRTLRVGPAKALLQAGDAARRDAAMPVTPEALDLYLRYFNPFGYDLLPEALLAAGFERPPLARYVAVLEKWTCGPVARQPGFGNRRFGLGPRTLAYARHAAQALAGGRWPSPVVPAALGDLARDDMGFDWYYREGYPVAYEACAETRALVREVGAPSRPRALFDGNRA